VKARLTAALLVILLLVATTACGPRHFRFPPAVDPPVGFVQEGVASWYGPGYHGKKTSSGEVFDQDEMTAAHMTFAFGTRVRVTMLSNGRSVVVRINDRFPNAKRVIDLSRGAARQIGLIGPGTGRVRLEVVG
jgi:rare lipoprotein A